MQKYLTATLVFSVGCSSAGASTGLREIADPSAGSSIVEMENTYAHLAHYDDVGETARGTLRVGAFQTHWEHGEIQFVHRDIQSGLPLHIDYGFYGSLLRVTEWKKRRPVTEGESAVEPSLVAPTGEGVSVSDGEFEEVATALAGVTHWTSSLVPRMLAGVDVFECRNGCVAQFGEKVMIDGVNCTELLVSRRGLTLVVTVGDQDHLMRIVRNADANHPAYSGIIRYHPRIE